MNYDACGIGLGAAGGVMTRASEERARSADQTRNWHMCLAAVVPAGWICFGADERT